MDDIRIGDYVRCDMEYNGQFWVRVDEVLDEASDLGPGIGGEVISSHENGTWMPVYDTHLNFSEGDILEIRRM